MVSVSDADDLQTKIYDEPLITRGLLSTHAVTVDLSLEFLVEHSERSAPQVSAGIPFGKSNAKNGQCCSLSDQVVGRVCVYRQINLEVFQVLPK